MSVIKIYTNIDSLFDTRRGIITHLARENGYTNFKWEMIEPIYKERRLNFYERPDLGITNEGFYERFEKRTIDDWADDKECYFYPTRLLDEMFLLIRELEFGIHSCISVSKFELDINLFPFNFSDQLLTELRSTIEATFKFPVTLNFVNVSYEQQTAGFMHGYQYVFDYWYFGKFNKTYFETYSNSQPSGTKFIVPDVLTKEVPEEMRNEPIGVIIDKYNFTQGGKVSYIPVNKSIYDYKEN